MKSTLILTILSLLLVGCSPVETRSSGACRNNMRQIEAAKDQAALEHGLAIGDDPAAFVAAFMKGGIPTCPVGGAVYNINNVGTDVTCSSGITCPGFKSKAPRIRQPWIRGFFVRENISNSACINNMRQIEGAKDQAALENGLALGDDPAAFVAAFIKGGMPTCPVGAAAYVVGNVGTDVTCPTGGTHVLP